MRVAYDPNKTMWSGKGVVDGKWHIGSLSTEGDKKFITDWKGKHEVDPKTVSMA